jgi:SpoVK/Ycf46/Vps4 family AAA+-type ATPase
MPTTKQLSELFRAIVSNDMQLAASAAKRIAQDEADRGNHKAARDLRTSLNGFISKGQVHSQSYPIAQNAMVQQCLSLMPDGPTLEELVLPDATRKQICELLLEWRHRATLTKQRIPRRWRLLFHGIPGCGKSVTARAIGRASGLPVYLVRFDALIGAYLGQTALRLREVFRFAAEQPCVLLFDEIDALAKRRGSPHEVGELDRIVIAFMQELEHAGAGGFIIGTCNLPHTLDDALWRRFDLAVQFPKPTPQNLLAFVRARCQALGCTMSQKFVSRCSKSASFAAAEQMVLDEARRRLLALVE